MITCEENRCLFFISNILSVFEHLLFISSEYLNNSIQSVHIISSTWNHFIGKMIVAHPFIDFDYSLLPNMPSSLAYFFSYPNKRHHKLILMALLDFFCLTMWIYWALISRQHCFDNLNYNLVIVLLQCCCFLLKCWINGLVALHILNNNIWLYSVTICSAILIIKCVQFWKELSLIGRSDILGNNIFSNYIISVLTIIKITVYLVISKLTNNQQTKQLV